MARCRPRDLQRELGRLLHRASDGPYTFSTVSDDGAWVYVDGTLRVDNGGCHSAMAATGSVTLKRGVHAIHVRYLQQGGPFHLDLLWGPRGQPLDIMPAWALAPRRVSFWRFVVSVVLRRLLAGAIWLWLGALLIPAVNVGWSTALKTRERIRRDPFRPALSWVIAGSLVLNLAGVWWGLPGGSWAPDELTPTPVRLAAEQYFSHGWFDRYPPFHYYILTAVFSPMMLLEDRGAVDLNGTAATTLLALISRLVSVAGGVGVLIAVYACGARAFGKRAGVLAAATLALAVPFVYYAKTANLDVPYLFWFSVSLLFYLRLLDGLKPIDFVWFAAFATLSVCTKDQAYGLYLLAPFAIIQRMWRVNHASRVPHPIVRAVLDRRLALAALTAATLFAACHNLVFNWSGFINHFRYITGGGSESYRMFEPAGAGRISLLRVTIGLIKESWGWPLFLISLAGLCIAVRTPQTRRATTWLLLPLVSYYFGFINVVLYNYDRFMLPIVLVLALFAGVALDRWLEPTGRARKWRLAAAAGVLAYTLLYAATVDVVMIRDSRYRVEQWLIANVERDSLIGYVFPRQYYPRLEAFGSGEINSIEQIQEHRPAYYVLNADYARAEPPDSQIGRLIAGLQGGTLGYHLVFRFRQPAPWGWLPDAHRDLVGDRSETLVTSALRHINPTFEVFKRGS